VREDLQKRIKEKIAKIAAVADDFPGVIIIYNIPEQKNSFMSPRGLQKLGITLEELQNMSMERYFDQFFNPEDVKNYVPKIMALVEENTDQNISFFQQVRISENHDWTWHMSSIKILMRNKEGRPLLLITMSYSIDPLSHVTPKVSRMLEENTFLRENHKAYSSLTKREVEILRMMALGENSMEMSEKLNISEKTVTTHRKNIRAKLKVQSNYDITRFAHAFDLI